MDTTTRFELTDSTERDDTNARYLATACDLAYLDEAAAAPRFRSQLGLEAKLFSVDNTQVYVGRNDRDLVVAFRGSQAPTTLDGLKDWLLTNANNFLVLPEGRIGTDFAAAGVGARFHRGFLQALDDIWEPLFREVESAQAQKERRLWVTGHSLGGALALLAAWRFVQNVMAVHQVYTFGAPMACNEIGAQAFLRELPGKIFRYVDEPDPVPLLPTVSLIANAYCHCQSEVYLGTKAATAAGLVSQFPQLGAKAVEGLLNATLIDELWDQVRTRVDAHMIASYLRRIAERSGGAR
jgi:hypothetical protein